MPARWTSAEWYAALRDRVAGTGLRTPTWFDGPRWPFDGQPAPRMPGPPRDEPVRGGADADSCFICTAAAVEDGSYLVWRDDLAMIGVPNEPGGLPFCCFLMPRRHADLAELTHDESQRLGRLLTLAERAATEVLDIPRLQVFRYGEGQRHLHWWLMGRPTGMPQLGGIALPLWDDVLPPTPPEDLRGDLEAFAARLTELVRADVRA